MANLQRSAQTTTVSDMTIGFHLDSGIRSVESSYQGMFWVMPLSPSSGCTGYCRVHLTSESVRQVHSLSYHLPASREILSASAPGFAATCTI